MQKDHTEQVMIFTCNSLHLWMECDQ